MRPISKISLFLLLIILIPLAYADGAQDEDCLPSVLSQGEVNSNNINIRADSTVNAKIICSLNKGEGVEIIQELYGWYKIRLPKTAPSFIKKSLVTLVGEKTAKVLKNNVNIRLNPNESSWILGKASKNEIVNILQDNGGWYKIEPVNNSFGWIHKKFVNKVAAVSKTEDTQSTQEIKKENKIINEDKILDKNITFEGIIKPYGKVLKRKGTHKLITADKKVFLLMGSKVSLDSLNYHKVKVTGKLTSSKDNKYPVIEIVKIEVLD